MSLFVQPHRRNPRRSRKAPKKYTDEECPLKGSGQAGYTNGIDFDQYDRQYDGLIHSDKKSLGEIIQEENDVRAMKGLSARLNEIRKMDVPDLVKDQLKKLTFGNNEKVKDADFIVPDGQEEELMFRFSESESEFESGDETSEDEYFSEEDKEEKSVEIKPCSAPKVQRPMDLLRSSSASHLFFKLEPGFCATCKTNVDFTIMSELETKEHGISGMCAPCQRSFFDAPKNNKK